MTPSLAVESSRGWLVLGGLLFACLASGLYLWNTRGRSGAKAAQVVAWLVLLGSALLLAFFVFVLWFADFSWMNQQ